MEEELQTQIASLIAKAAAEVIEAVAAAEKADVLAAVRDAEAAGKNRVTVILAIDKRLAELAAPVAKDPREGKPPHKENAEWPNQHDGAPCPNCGISAIVWKGLDASCQYCDYEWKH